MSCQRFGFGWSAALALVLVGNVAQGEGRAVKGRESLHLNAGQKEFLWLEPILVTLRLDSTQVEGLPAAPGKSKLGTLRFEIEPAVKVRPGAKPLPLEGQVTNSGTSTRLYDLFEWFAFPESGGTWTVRAVFEGKGSKQISAPLTVTISKPAPKDSEHGPMARLHHTPWSNYDTNAFCGDTFDLVQRWPKSRFARYCHYWNGRFLQNKKEYDKAIASYRTVIAKYPDFALADAAEFGIIQCLCAQKKIDEAQKRNAALQKKLSSRSAGKGTKPGAIQQLAENTAQRLDRDLGQK
jgi:hypothetical protein